MSAPVMDWLQHLRQLIDRLGLHGAEADLPSMTLAELRALYLRLVALDADRA
jgi:hypothetical protein